MKTTTLLCIDGKTGRVARYIGPVVTIKGKNVFLTHAATLDEHSIAHLGTAAVRSLLERYRLDSSVAKE